MAATTHKLSRLLALLVLVAVCSVGCGSDVDCDLPIHYANFGDGFMRSNCQGCHHSDTDNRFGAPESVVFDTRDDVESQLGRIIERTYGDTGGMPPAGGIPAEDVEKLKTWLECGAG